MRQMQLDLRDTYHNVLFSLFPPLVGLFSLMMLSHFYIFTVFEYAGEYLHGCSFRKKENVFFKTVLFLGTLMATEHQTSC